jgi:DNA-directed RNA polymerase subunit RPC12/RpoP
MECPKCKKEINHVNVFSQCWQRADLEGNQIVEYGIVEDVLETQGIECPLCGGDVSEFIKE